MTTHRSTSQRKTQRGTALGRLIRARREQLGLGTAAFAQQAGIARSHLWYIEDGTIEHVKLDKFCQIAAALHIPPDELLRQAGYIPPAPTSPLLEPDEYLRQRYHLSPEGVRQAVEYLEFLAQREQGLREKSR
jgi:transcriptional regulator with XRE-family HTH domain